jgi:hypothetical protein
MVDVKIIVIMDRMVLAVYHSEKLNINLIGIIEEIKINFLE